MNVKADSWEILDEALWNQIFSLILAAVEMVVAVVLRMIATDAF